MSIIIALLLVLAPQHAGVAEIRDEVVRRYSRMNDFSAEFVQITTEPSNQRRTYRGLLYLKSGRRMVLKQDAPGESWYSDGKTATVYRPGRKQASQRPLKKAEDEVFSLFQIPWNPEVKNQYSKVEGLSEPPLKPGHRLIRLTPNKKDLPVIKLEVDPATYLIHRFVTTTPDGSSNEFQFTNLKTTPLDKALFEFKAPPGTDVIQEK
jgi:chaperone LolA